MQEDIQVRRSNGYGKGGRSVYYIRPVQKCDNKSRKVTGFNYQEIEPKKEKLINKWYAPMVILYEIEGWVIGSNNKENALKEYWRICELSDVGKPFEVKIL